MLSLICILSCTPHSSIATKGGSGDHAYNELFQRNAIIGRRHVSYVIKCNQRWQAARVGLSKLTIIPLIFDNNSLDLSSDIMLMCDIREKEEGHRKYCLCICVRMHREWCNAYRFKSQIWLDATRFGRQNNSLYAWSPDPSFLIIEGCGVRD